jgi:D-galactose 1-dehydrogenase
MDGNRIGVGIVGFGKIAQDQHVAAIRESRRFFLHSVADHRECAAPVHRYPDVETMLAAQDRPDAIAICTPPQVRFGIACKALTHGVPVLLEKPPCVTLDEAAALCELARDSGVSLFCAWHSRFAPAVVPAREWLAQRRAQRVRIDWLEDVRVWHPGQEWIWESGGFGVFDAGINALSIATKILPQPLVVRDALLRVPEGCDAAVSAELALSDADGIDITASFDFLQTGPQTWEIEVETDRGLLRLLDGGSRLLLDGEESNLGSDGEYAKLYTHFADLVDACRIDVDLAPMRLVAESLSIGRVERVPPLHLLFSEDETSGTTHRADARRVFSE